jgi:hypothetical protein
MLYTYAFILDPRAKMRCLYNVFQLLVESIGTYYTSNYFSEVKTELYKLCNKYEKCCLVTEGLTTNKSYM